MSETKKKHAEIDGYVWEVGYPLCAGCPELIVGDSCGWEGNGCRFPKERMKTPISFKRGFFKLAGKDPNKSVEQVCDELGNCLGQIHQEL
jgi:hypothetical protein